MFRVTDDEQHSSGTGPASLDLTTPAGLNRLIEIVAAAGEEGTATLLRARRDGLIGLLVLTSTTSEERFATFEGLDVPAIVLIDDSVQAGPDEWPLSGRAVDWAPSILVSSSAENEATYFADAVAAAQIIGRIMIVRTRRSQIPAWLTLICAAPHAPILTLVATPDAPAADQVLQ